MEHENTPYSPSKGEKLIFLALSAWAIVGTLVVLVFRTI